MRNPLHCQSVNQNIILAIGQVVVVLHTHDIPLGGFTPLQSSTLSAVADRLGAKPMPGALAWLLRRSPSILLIAGTSPTSAKTWLPLS